MELSSESIVKRISVRSYTPLALSKEEKEAIEGAFIESSPGPFGQSPRFVLLSNLGEASGGKVGTYGVIKGATSFIAGMVKKGDFACVDYGYCLEGVILRATELGLGTCWLGGFFDRGAVMKSLAAGRDEFCPAATPIGRAAEKRGLQDRLIRRQAGSHQRKDASELFFEAGEAGAWLPLSDAGAFGPILEAVRIGPSASNKQPWRLVLDPRPKTGAILHLVLEEDKFYNNMLGDVKLQELDMGIAMRHVEVASTAAGLSGHWRRLPASPIKVEASRRYIASFMP